MILLNDFFTIDEKTVSDTEIKTQLHINAGHRIFEGHFPNHPVVPGVCMMQMIKEILEHILGKETNLVQATDMKFLAIINPQEKNLIQASIKYVASESGKISIQATLYKDELVHFKFKGQLQAS